MSSQGILSEDFPLRTLTILFLPFKLCETYVSPTLLNLPEEHCHFQKQELFNWLDFREIEAQQAYIYIICILKFYICFLDSIQKLHFDTLKPSLTLNIKTVLSLSACKLKWIQWNHCTYVLSYCSICEPYQICLFDLQLL